MVAGLILLLAEAQVIPVAQAQLVPTAQAEALPLNPVADTTTPITWAALNENLSFIFPNASFISGLKYHSMWREVLRRNMTESTGIEVIYEAILDEAPNFTDELPTINLYILPKSSRAAAEAQFETWKSAAHFSNGNWVKLSEGQNHFTYLNPTLKQNDLIKTRPLEEASLHLVRQYDNVLIVANFYRPGGIYLKNNVQAFSTYLASHEETTAVMDELAIFTEEAMRFFLGSTFSIEGPSDDDYHPDSAAYSLSVNSTTEFPRNGNIQLDLYIDDASEIGTIIDTAGLNPSTHGHFNLTLTETGTLEFNWYDARQTSSCSQGNGWHTLVSPALKLYEWQTVMLRFGAKTGLELILNDEKVESCELKTPRAESTVYLGDYPEDGVKQSFLGYVKDLKIEYSHTEEGQRLDTLQDNMIFTDVSEAHPNAVAIEFMKEKGVIKGYDDGSFQPYRAVNRAEILKMLLLGFNYKIPENTKNPKVKDVERTDWYVSYLNYAIDAGIIGGYPDGTYRPSNPVNRVEFLKILLKAYGATLNDYPITTLYPDTDRDAWYAAYVQYAKNYNLMEVDANGNFNPGSIVTRAEVAETLYRLTEKS